MPFYMPPKIRNSEKDASCLKNVLDFLDLKYSALRHLHVLLQWTFVVPKIEFPSHVVGVGPVLSHKKHILLQVAIHERTRVNSSPLGQGDFILHLSHQGSELYFR